MPIEPMSAVDYTHERAPDSFVGANQPTAFWGEYYPGTSAKPIADPVDRDNGHIVFSPQTDAVYRTLMQRAADANAPDHSGNVAIQLTANLVYGYQPSDVVFPKVEASVRIARPEGLLVEEQRRPIQVPPHAATAKSDPTFITLPSDLSEKRNAAATRDLFNRIYDIPPAYQWLQNLDEQTSNRDDESAFARSPENTVGLFLNELEHELTEIVSEIAVSAKSGSSETNAAESDRSENEVDGGFHSVTSTVADDLVLDSANNASVQEETECGDDEEDYLRETTEFPPEISDITEEVVDEVEILGQHVQYSTELPTTTASSEEDEDGNIGQWILDSTQFPTTTTPSEEDENVNGSDSDEDTESELNLMTTEGAQETLTRSKSEEFSTSAEKELETSTSTIENELLYLKGFPHVVEIRSENTDTNMVVIDSGENYF